MTKKVRTCVYAIALNEIAHVEKFMAASSAADLILVCDTGSTDGTPEKLKQLGAQVYNISLNPWRFDIARNTALNLIPNNIDICLSIDLDEYLQPNWAVVLDAAWQKSNGNLKRVAYDYVWNWEDDGVTPKTRFFADKIHHRLGYIWKHPCHEALYWQNQEEEVRVVVPEISLHHRADIGKSRAQYLNLLELAVREDPQNDRMAHYYARELMYWSKFPESIKEFLRHLSLKTASWKEERCASYRYIARCYRYMEKFEESQRYAIAATQEWPYTREPWMELARTAYTQEDWATCFWATNKCLSIKERTFTYMVESESWGWEPYDLGAISAHFLGLKDKAIAYGNEALRLNPLDKRLQSNIQFYTNGIR